MKNILVILSVVILVAGCNVKRPVTGSVRGTDESITGDASEFRGTSGKVHLTLSSGVTCEGRITKMVNKGGSKGRLDCSDGRGGPITVLASQTGGHGFGDLNGSEFSFTFGSYSQD